MATRKESSGTIEVPEVSHQAISFNVLGLTPIILNRMSEKAMRTILCPPPPTTRATKASRLKHDPTAEFLASPYVDRSENAPTLIQHLASAFKGAIKGAAVDMPGAKKAQIGRLTWVPGERIPIYGIPQIFSSVVRSADINRTPDIRTRAIIPRWACQVTIEYVIPILNAQSVTNLFSTAGITQGIGDWRPEKGSATYGQFKIVNSDDPEFNLILEEGGREAQKRAMENPVPYDLETEELLAWFREEVKRRGFPFVCGVGLKSNGHDDEEQEENDDERESSEDSSAAEVAC